MQVANNLDFLIDELRQVELEINTSLADLRAPFSQLVQSQLREGLPLRRGAFVLTAGVGAGESDLLKQKRIYLGAAIEVLRLALAIHTRLLAASESQAGVDRSLLGSTVLAGDFCFSRAAGLAAKTDSPVVVDVFAQALQRVSEGTLRGLFHPSETMFDVERELCLSGVTAANELANIDEPQRRADLELAGWLLDNPDQCAAHGAELPQTLTILVAPQRAARWQGLAQWLGSR